MKQFDPLVDTLEVTFKCSKCGEEVTCIVDDVPEYGWLATTVGDSEESDTFYYECPYCKHEIIIDVFNNEMEGNVIVWMDDGEIDYWLFSNEAAEWSYIGLTHHCGWNAQDARDVLPLDTKSILVHSAFIEDWRHFFDLRANGTTGAPHPQAKELAESLMKEFEKRGLL